ncbi:MAG TPA: SCO family protein [Streptosporangiaceae bacterium]|nr:SCO family protein [Streptosporangiaceae bacterium]
MNLRLSRRHPQADGQQPAAGRGGQAARPARRPGWVAMAGLLVLLAAGTSAYVLARQHNPPAGGELRPSGIPAGISTSLANLMVLSPLPREAAPGFTLTDQAGRTVGLSGFRGKVVVLEFMDDHCTDICPIVSQEFIDAYHDLGTAAGKVVFAAVNVNPSYRSVSAVAAFSAEHQLTTIPGWHFLTGPLPALRATWRDYNIAVQVPNPRADIVHTSAIYFIDPQGTERYLASPEDAGQTKPRFAYGTKNETGYVPAGQMTDWGRGIAQVARSLAG